MQLRKYLWFGLPIEMFGIGLHEYLQETKPASELNAIYKLIRALLGAVTAPDSKAEHHSLWWRAFSLMTVIIRKRKQKIVSQLSLK